MRIAIAIAFFFFATCRVQAQEFVVNSQVLVKLQLTIGNQNQGLKIGAYGMANVRYGDAAFETGAALYSGYLFKRHTIKNRGFNYGYDFFALVGIGENDNLLGSSFHRDTPLLFNEITNQKFSGLGFGFEKEWLPSTLAEFNQKIGKFLLRFANANHSINIAFKNDFRFGKIFNGEGTDFGNTGMLQITYSEYRTEREAYHFGMALQLFTPEANYSLTPNNPINSDDGSKNVWYTKGQHAKLFYANVYALGAYQNDRYFAFAKAGSNSQKSGAYIQNTLHDSFGLNPRYPWNTASRDKLFVETGLGLYIHREND